jgi:hypothetical protein
MAKGVFTPEIPTDNDILLGEGVFYADYGEVGEAIIGATRGGSKLEVERVIREMPFDGAYGPHKGLRRYERYAPKFTVNLLKMTYLSLSYGMPCDTSDEGNYHELVFRLNIEDADYLTNIAFVGKKHDGKPCIIIIYNALNDGNISLDFKEKDEVVGEMQYTGHYDDSTPTTPPLEIRDYDVAA